MKATDFAVAFINSLQSTPVPANRLCGGGTTIARLNRRTNHENVNKVDKVTKRPRRC